MSFLSRPVANRGVHLRITPRPSNLGETREILRLLSQFGEIDYFKHLKYDGQGLDLPRVALVIYKDEEGAKNCFRGSPVRFRMGKVRPGSNRSSIQERVKQVEEQGQEEESISRGGAWGLGEAPVKKGPLGVPFGLEPEPQRQRRYSSTSSLPKPPPRPIRMPFDPPSPPDLAAQKHEDEDRIFEIRTSPTIRNFRDTINQGHYHGSFAIDSKMAGQEDLMRRVPNAGMSCVNWRAAPRPWRFVKKDQSDSDLRLGVLWEKYGEKAAKAAAHGEENERPKAKRWATSWSELLS